MTEEAKLREPINPADLFGPPFFGVGLGEKLGSLEARLIHVEKDISDVKDDLKNLNARVERLDARVERLDAKVESLDVKVESLDVKVEGLAVKVEGLTLAVAHLDARLTAQDGAWSDKFAGLEKKLENNAKLLYGIFTALLTAIIVQKFI